MIRNPDFANHVRAIFAKATFVSYLGIGVDRVEQGLCETSLTVEPRHAQQDGFAHAGVLITMADHTAGGAAATLVDKDQGVLTVDLSVHFLRAARGTRMVCKSKVLKPGRTLSVVESEVYSIEAGASVLAAKATVTLAIVARPSHT